jgi:hypothetical protein
MVFVSPLASYAGEGLAALHGTTLRTPCIVYPASATGPLFREATPLPDGTRVYKFNAALCQRSPVSKFREAPLALPPRVSPTLGGARSPKRQVDGVAESVVSVLECAAPTRSVLSRIACTGVCVRGASRSLKRSRNAMPPYARPRNPSSGQSLNGNLTPLHPTPVPCQWREVTRLSQGTPRPSGVTMAYGTAGFRAKASLLPSTFLRMGFLAAMRAQQTGQVRDGMRHTGHLAGTCGGGRSHWKNEPVGVWLERGVPLAPRRNTREDFIATHGPRYQHAFCRVWVSLM